MNIGVRVSLSIMVSSGYMPSGGIAIVVLFLVLSPYYLTQWLYKFTFPPKCKRVSFSPHPLPFIVCRFFADGHSDV